jgi:hypothetical protein
MFSWALVLENSSWSRVTKPFNQRCTPYKIYSNYLRNSTFCYFYGVKTHNEIVTLIRGYLYTVE